MRDFTPTLRTWLYIIPIMIMTSTLSAFAQQAVTGKIIDDKTNETVVGASVKVKGSSAGTVTDVNGTFKLSVTSGAVLQISYIGYNNQELAADPGKPMLIKLTSSAKELGDVVVVGYGTQKKATLTGAVSTVDAKVFQNRGPLSSPLAALQGQVPGVTVSRSSAQTGRENWNFQVRGQTSSNGADPLIVIDGVPVPSTSALNSLNPNDIDNISFLKDAAASIYGSRAAGGVVLITTKRGKEGKLVVDYNGSVSIKKVGLQPTLVKTADWGPYIKEALTNDGQGESYIWNQYANIAIYASQRGLTHMTKQQVADAGLPNGFTDVLDFPFYPESMNDILFGSAVSTEHQLSLSQRTEKQGFRLSLGYLNDASLLKPGNNSNKRYNLRLTHDYQLSSRISLQSNVSLEKNDIIQPTGINNVLNNGIQTGLPPTSLNGKPYLWGSGLGNASPYSIAEFGGDNKELNTRINANFMLNYNVTNHLKAVASLGTYYLHGDYRTQENAIQFYDITGTIPNGLWASTTANSSRSSYQRGSLKDTYYTGNAYLEYSNSINKDHEFKIMGGGQYEYYENNRFYAKTFDLLAGAPPSLGNSFGDISSKTVAEAQQHYALAGYFSRFNYNYKGKYLFEADARYDGSSKFQADQRWKFFYGFQAGWRIQQESFLKNVKWLNDLKIRATYGRLGSQTGISNYDYVQFLNLNSSQGPNNAAYPILGTTPVVRVSPAGLVAYDRTWETLETSDIGLDFSLFNSRLSGTADIYLKRNRNMLLDRTFPSVLGATAPRGNNGELETKGFEFALNWKDRIGEVTYNIGGNISDSRNTLVNFGNQTLIAADNGDLRGFNRAVQGYPLNSYFGLEYGGRIQTSEQLDAARTVARRGSNVYPTGTDYTNKTNTLQLGDNMYVDRNGDGRISFPEDAMYLGTDDPRYSFGISGGVQWKGFDFSFILQGVAKRSIQRTGNWRLPVQTIFQAQNDAFRGQTWLPTRTDAYYPRSSATGTINNSNYFASDWQTESGSYLRLKNLVVGYTLPVTFTQKASLKRVRVYFSGNDLWEITKIKDGWDPEAPRTVNNTADANNNNVATFSGRFPFYRYLTFGVNVTL